MEGGGQTKNNEQARGRKKKREMLRLPRVSLHSARHYGNKEAIPHRRDSSRKVYVYAHVLHALSAAARSALTSVQQIKISEHRKSGSQEQLSNGSSYIVLVLGKKKKKKKRTTTQNVIHFAAHRDVDGGSGDIF